MPLVVAVVVVVVVWVCEVVAATMGTPGNWDGG